MHGREQPAEEDGVKSMNSRPSKQPIQTGLTPYRQAEYATRWQGQYQAMDIRLSTQSPVKMEQGRQELASILITCRKGGRGIVHAGRDKVLGEACDGNQAAY